MRLWKNEKIILPLEKNPIKVTTTLKPSFLACPYRAKEGRINNYRITKFLGGANVENFV
jgi:hypothetical protein